MGTGVGGGLADGVQMAGQFIMPAMQMKQRQKMFDAQMEQNYDRMALEKAWVERHGMPSSGQAAQQPYQVTMDAKDAPTPAQFLGFSDPTKAATPTPTVKDWDPVNAQPMRSTPSPAASIGPSAPSMGVKEKNPFMSGPIPPVSEMRPRRFGRRY